MKQHLIFTLALVSLLAFLTAGLAYADGIYTIPWWTVDGGGGVSTSLNPAYTLNGTIGQPDAGTIASGGAYTLAGGFWHGGAIAQPGTISIFLPLINR